MDRSESMEGGEKVPEEWMRGSGIGDEEAFQSR